MFGIDDALLGAGVSAIGGLIGNAMSADSAESAQNFSSAQYATRYQTTIKDLEAAGLSPMLAYSQGAGSAPTGVSYTAQNPFAGVPSAYASTKNLEPQAEQMRASAEASRAQAAVSDETVSKIKQEVSNLQTDQQKAKATIDVLREDYQNRVKEGYNLTEQGNVMRATISKLQSEVPNLHLDYLRKELENQLLHFDVSAAGSVGNFGRNFGQFKPFFDTLMRVLGTFKK